MPRLRLKHFAINNFRIFSDKTDFDFAPITILIGPNNAGKSTLLKALNVFIGNANRKDITPLETFLGSLKMHLPDVKISPTNFFPFNAANNTFKAELQFYLNRQRETSMLDDMLRGTKICLTYNLSDYDSASFELSKLEFIDVEINEAWLIIEQNLLSKEESKLLRGNLKNVDLLWELLQDQNTAIPDKMSVYKYTFSGPFFRNLKDVLESYYGLVLRFYNQFKFSEIFEEKKFSKLRSFDIKKLLDDKEANSDILEQEKAFGYVVCIIKMLYDRNDGRVLDFDDAFKSFLSDLESWSSGIDFVQTGFHFTKRGLFFPDNIFNNMQKPLLLYLGEFFKSMRGHFRNDYESIGSIRSPREKFISRSDEDYLSKILFSGDFKEAKANHLLKEVLRVADKIIVKDIEDELKKIMVEKNGKQIDLVDMGYGLTQLLPLLISPDTTNPYLWQEYLGEAKTWLLSEPEANLHPSLQSRLADLFAYQWKEEGSTFIIETHSEYLIRKLQYLTAKGEIKPEDTVIYYFYPPDDVPPGEDQVKKINIQEDGSLTYDFGSGFFDEADKIAMSIWNMNKSQKN